MKRNFVFLTSAFLLLLAVNAFAAEKNIYVDPSSDSSQGTYESPFRHFSDINWSTIQNWINAGNDVNINLKCGKSWDEEFIVKASGNSNHPITITSYGSGDKPRIDRNSYDSGLCLNVTGRKHIVIDGLDFRDGGAGINLIDSEYTVIKNCYFTNLDKGVYSNDAYYVTIGGSAGNGNTFYNIGDDTGSSDISCNSGSHDWVISYNHLYADSSTRGIDGVLVERVYNVLIEHNTIHGHNDSSGEKGENAVDIKYSSTHDIIVRYNNMYNYRYEGVMHVQKGVHDIYIYGNRIADGQTGILVAYGWNDNNANPYNIHIFSNLILDNQEKGISDGNGEPYNIYVYNNTFAGNGGSASNNYASAIGFDNGRNNYVRNNIFINNEDSRDGDRRQLAVGSGETGSTLLSNNLFYHSKDGDNTKIYWGSKGLVKGSNVGDSNECADPGVDAQYRLQIGSVAIDNGVNLGKTVATITITDGSANQKVIAIDYRDSLDPDNTDWSVIPAKVNTISRSSSGTWTQGAYAYGTNQNLLEPPVLSIATP